jgi:salicylate biosynthesis isochorismate synthase
MISLATEQTRRLRGDIRTRLERRLADALKRARAAGSPRVASLTAPLPAGSDPVAIVCLSRAPGEPWFCLEQPDRSGAAVAGLGAAYTLEAAGDLRFTEIDRAWRAVCAHALADSPDGPPGSGLIATGGFAFAPERSESPHWDGFAQASLVVPECSVARMDRDVRLTLNLLVAPDDTIEGLLQRADARLASLREGPLPLLDPAPAGRFRVASAMPPSHFEHAVERAVQQIRAGELEKVVLAREVHVHAPSDYDPAAIVGVLRDAFGSCYVYAVGRGDAVFIGASPELLVRREGNRASTVALAGSTRRSADPAVDDHLGEQLLRSDKDRHENAIVARRIARQLAPLAVWVATAPEPVLVKVANIQHLALPIRAQLSRPAEALELTGLLHPTPAVGGEPIAIASRLIPALEGMDRGWYAGPVGWTDMAGDGEFCVALRCALLRGHVAHCFAGCGIVADSDPAAELAESEVKLGAILPLLSG